MLPRHYGYVSALSVMVALASSFYFGQSDRPYDLVGVKFCPHTANSDADSQAKLNSKYCVYEHKMLREVWEDMQFESLKPIPETSVVIRSIPAIETNLYWFLVAPIASGIGYLTWSKKAELEEFAAHEELEAYKTCIKLIGANSRGKRDFTDLKTSYLWELRKIQDGLVSEEAIAHQAAKQTEIKDKLHASALKEMDAANSEYEKKIAENLRDKHKADSESKKICNSLVDLSSDAEATDKLKLEDKYKWIYQLLKLPLRVLSGNQGSGKSTLERFMIRLLKDDGYHIVVINPETNPSVWSGVEVLASGDEINEFLSGFMESLESRVEEARRLKIDEDDYLSHIRDRTGREGRVAIFAMESNTYEIRGVDPDLWASFLKQSLTNIRKWGFTLCLTAHSDNQTSISSKLKGFSDRLNDAPRVTCIAATDDKGEAISSGKALLRMGGTSDKEPIEVELYNYPRSKKF